MNITIFSIAFNGYGKYIDKWLESVLNQTIKPKEIIIVLGINHETPKEVIDKAKSNNVKIIYERKKATMGYLHNLAIKESNSEWVLRVDIDDTLLSHAIEEIKKKDYCDAVSLKFILDGKEKLSPIPSQDKLYQWRNLYKESGYVAIKKQYNDEILYYDDNNFANLPYLFKAVSIGMKFGFTEKPCAVYQKIKHDNPILKSQEAMKEAYNTLDKAAIKYRKKDIFLTVIVPIYNTEHLITRCLDSIELREDIEIIIIDDCSVDESVKKVKEWINNTQFKNIRFIQNKINLGVGATVNKGYDLMNGEYVLTLCDDDYLLEPLTKLIKELDGTDLVYFDLKSNSGKVWDGKKLPGSTKVYKKSIIGNTKRKDQNFGGDKVFHEEILAKNPTKKETKLLLYYYDYPRKNSLMDQWKNSFDITVFTIVYNGYGEFIPQWLENLNNQIIRPKKIIVVLGKNHKADIDWLKQQNIEIINSKSDVMGTLRNKAIEKIETEWMLYFSVDDKLLPNAIEEIKNKSKYDALALRYLEKTTNGDVYKRQSGIIDSYLKWRKIPIPGYIAVKRQFNNKILYYEEVEIPNYPYLFLIKHSGMKITNTDNECAVYKKREGSHGDIALKTNNFKKYSEFIDERAIYYQQELEKKVMELKVLETFNDRYNESIEYTEGKIIELPFNQERLDYILNKKIAKLIQIKERNNG